MKVTINYPIPMVDSTFFKSASTHQFAFLNQKALLLLIITNTK